MRSRPAKIASAIAAVSLFSSIHSNAAVVTWTGADSSNLWTDGNNWNPAAQPGSGDEALFNNAGNGQTSPSPGGSASVGSIEFDSGAAGYTVGSSSDTLNLSSGTVVTLTGGVSQAVNASLSLTGSGTFANTTTNGLTFGSSSSSIITLPALSTLTVLSSKGGTITINASVEGNANLLLPGSPVAYTAGSAVVFAGQSTYSGTTTQSSGNNLTVLIASSSDTTDPSTYTSGPFGKSTIVANNSSNTPFEPAGADRTIDNPWNLAASGVTFKNAASGAFNLTLAGPIDYTDTNSTGRSFTSFDYGKTLTLGSAGTPSTITLERHGVNLAVTPGVDPTLGGATIVINDQIVDGSGVTAADLLSYNANGGQGVLVLNNGNSTYSGGTTFNGGSAGQQALTVLVNADSTGSPGSVTSGPFGTGAMTMNAANTPPIFVARNADRTIINALTLTSGFFAAGDSGGNGAHNLTFLAPFTDSKIITNNIPAGKALFFGSSSSTTTILTIAGGAKFQSQSGAGVTVFNDVIGGTGAASFQIGGTLYVNNLTSSFNGTLNVIGTGTGIASNGLGTGATLAGKGRVGTGAGVVVIGATVSGNVGGMMSPGGDGTTLTGLGTITVPNLTLDPLGRYIYDFDPTNSAVGSGVNDLVSINGALNVTGLSGGKFDLDLQPLAAGAPQAQYTLATFASIIGALAGADVTADVSFSGITPAGYTPTVTVAGDGKSLLLNFAAVPEPGSLSLLAIGGLSMMRRRRK